MHTVRHCTLLDTITAEFLEKEDWHWYVSETGDDEISQIEIELGRGPEAVWVTDKYHWVHCQFTWLKLHRAILGKKPLDAHLNKYKHTLHCAEALALHSSEPHGRAQFTLGFSSCSL